jgi:hypothetical protein
MSDVKYIDDELYGSTTVRGFASLSYMNEWYKPLNYLDESTIDEYKWDRSYKNRLCLAGCIFSLLRGDQDCMHHFSEYPNSRGKASFMYLR